MADHGQGNDEIPLAEPDDWLRTVPPTVLIKLELTEYEGCDWSEKDHVFTATKVGCGGYSVALHSPPHEPQHWIVYIGDGAHFHLHEPLQAVGWFLLACTDNCRVHVLRRGNFPYRFTVEVKQEEGWKPCWETGLLLFPFWRKKSAEYHYFDRPPEAAGPRS